MAEKQWVPVPFIDQGINRAMAPDQIGLRETPQCMNMDFEPGQCYTRDGFRYVGEDGAEWPLDGTKVLFCDSLSFSDGSSHTLAITDTKAYTLETTGTGSAVWSAIITFSAYSGGPVSIGSVVPLVMASVNRPMTHDLFLDENGTETYIFANGGHVLCYNSAQQMYHLSGGEGYRDATTSDGSKTNRFHKADCVMVYDFRVFLGVPRHYDTDQATELAPPQRLRYSGVGNLASWTSTDYVDLISDARKIKGGKVLKDALVVYKPGSIHTVRRTGSGEVPYRHDMMVEGAGVMWNGAIANTPYGHVFVDSDAGNIRVYQGGFDAPSISQKIFTRYDSLDKIERGSREQIVSAVDEKWERVYFAIPVYDTVTGAVKNQILIVYDYRNKNWTRYKCVGADTLGWRAHDSSVAWEDLEGTWEGQRWKWRDMYSMDSMLLTSDSSKYTRIGSLFYASDEGTDYGAYIKSAYIPRGGPPDQRYTFHTLQFRSSGTGQLRVSTDTEEDFVTGVFTSSDNDGRNHIPLGGKTGHWLQLQFERSVDDGSHFETRDIWVLLQAEATEGTVDYE